MTDKNESSDTRNDMGRYVEKAIPLSLVVAAYKTMLLKPVAETITSRIEGKKKLTERERHELQTVIRAEIAQLPPSIFNIDPKWTPKSIDDINKKIERDFNKEKLEEIINLVTKGLKKKPVLTDYLG